MFNMFCFAMCNNALIDNKNDNQFVLAINKDDLLYSSELPPPEPKIKNI